MYRYVMFHARMELRFAIIWCGFFVAKLLANEHVQKQPPHIIIIMADDLGWNDVGFHGSDMFPTPNIDALAYNGIILNDFHTPSQCTSSRASLLTGKFPINIGMQRSTILEAEPWGLPTSYQILPQYLNSVGYESHMTGKWHLGFFQRDYTPTLRGFESFFGFWQGHQDYYSHECHETFGNFVGFDLRENLESREDLKSCHTGDLINSRSVDLIEKHNPSKPLFLFVSHIAPHSEEPNKPLQPPKTVTEMFSYIKDESKRKYAAMVSLLDECIGNIMNALNRQNMLENSIVLFMSDNGSPTIGLHLNTGSNYPLRGMKVTEFEGGTRVPAIIWSPLFKDQQRVTNIMMHIVDVLPTLCTAAGVDPEDFKDIDGISMWDTILQGSEQSPRTEYTYNIDPADENNSAGAVRVGDWKYYKGNDEKTGAKYLWPGDKYSNSEYDKFFYDIAQITHSLTNNAIVEFYRQNEGKTDWEPINETKIQQLREKTKIMCPTLEGLPQCDVSQSCLFNLKEDPCERYDFSTLQSKEYEDLKQKFEIYRKKVVEPLNKPRDRCANPKYWNGVWSSWYDFDIVLKNLAVKGALCKVTDYVFSLFSSTSNVLDGVFRYFHW